MQTDNQVIQQFLSCKDPGWLGSPAIRKLLFRRLRLCFLTKRWGSEAWREGCNAVSQWLACCLPLVGKGSEFRTPKGEAQQKAQEASDDHQFWCSRITWVPFPTFLDTPICLNMRCVVHGKKLYCVPHKSVPPVQPVGLTFLTEHSNWQGKASMRSVQLTGKPRQLWLPSCEGDDGIGILLWEVLRLVYDGLWAFLSWWHSGLRAWGRKPPGSDARIAHQYCGKQTRVVPATARQMGGLRINHLAESCCIK